MGQLRAINPPLPARDITTHRLQLEDCIRQVEQEASEANIAGMGADAVPPTLPPVFAAEAKARPAPAKPVPVETPKAEAPKKPESKPSRAARPNGTAGASIEDIIAAAERDSGADEPEAPPPAPKAPEIKSRPPKSQPVLVAKSEPPAKEPAKPESKRPPAKPEARPLPSIVARAEAAKGRPVAPSFAAANDSPRRAGGIDSRRGVAATARQMQPMEFDVPEDVAAMAAVREVEVEQPPADPQGAIDRAIATLDREARGDTRPANYADTEVELDDEPMQAPARKNGFFNGRAADMPVLKGEQRDLKTPRPAKEFATPRRQSSRAFPDGVPAARQERGGLGAVTIFLIIFVALLLGAGGAGFWAWQEGFINLDAMFGKGTTAVATAATPAPVVTPDSSGPGNTETPAATTEPSTQLQADQQRLPAAQVAAIPAPSAEAVAPLALQSDSNAGKTEARLGSDSGQPQSAQDATVAAIDPASVAGSQSLLLEAQDNGTTGAVPFSGTVDWSKGVDENGQPTLVGKANIPARNLTVDVLIRKNSDPQLPASHLMEINFTVSDSFIGGSIAGLPGVLLKDEELTQGTPLVGASARVVGNSFLFALSAAPEDTAANTKLLTDRKWMDLALIYASGKRAIITLEKDDKAQQLFSDVFAAWSKTAKG
ncbi:MAG: hypothetical protein BGO82_00085 [Devosia sp. 67-54]|uniref:hypothetical protein n=1 Tax=unclassified Devosia TaxID=196773 RepID=UPI00095B68BA|nr:MULTISPECIES: hypothetical protein [unclassified Devosia]MBN9306139.1 hypothetical protein [Devosia sp.]OJX16197.1 MAG: hypothetical protein BGO82_00085 [Devosia sp. 67-54]